jgi:ribosome-binding protein aMBF1 (putative translation factor)
MEGEELIYYVRLGMGITRARKAAGVSKTELSKYLGLKKACCITSYEDVKMRIPAYRLHKISEKLGVSIQQLENANNPL